MVTAESIIPREAMMKTKDLIDLTIRKETSTEMTISKHSNKNQDTYCTSPKIHPLKTNNSPSLSQSNLEKSPSNCQTKNLSSTALHKPRLLKSRVRHLLKLKPSQSRNLNLNQNQFKRLQSKPKNKQNQRLNPKQKRLPRQCKFNNNKYKPSL